jgi:hypothetical protein
MHIGLQCHVEMTEALVQTWCETGASEIGADPAAARQPRDEIVRELGPRVRALKSVAGDVYARWAHGLRH